MKKIPFYLLSLALLGAHSAFAAQTWPVYDDATRNQWSPWGWAKEIKYDSTAPVHAGTTSISVKPAAWEAIFLHHDAFDNSAYDAIDFWIHGGEAGGQK